MGLFPAESFVIPIIFVMPEGASDLYMVPVQPTLVRKPTIDGALRSSDPGNWMEALLAEELPDCQIASRVHPLLPRPMRGGRLAIPVWAMARARGSRLELEHPMDALHRLGSELGDPGLGRQVMSAIHAALATDPFAQRVVGDEVRLSALSRDRLADGDKPSPGLPAVVALLPESFTLGELQQAIAATLDLPPHAMESGSSFRRRIQEFVHRRVLRETSAQRESGDGDRVGRPPRRYVFDPRAWREWLNECGERSASKSSFEGEAQFSPLLSEKRAMGRRHREPLEMESDRLVNHSQQLPPTAAFRIAPRLAVSESRDQDTDADRIARLEQMVERLAKEAKERRREE